MTQQDSALTPWQLKALWWSVFLTALGYLAFSLWGGYEEVLRAAERVGWLGGLVVLGLAFLSYVLRFARWHLYIRFLGETLPWGAHFRIYLSGFALTTTPGKAGEMIRSVFLKPWGVSYTQSIAAFFSERLSDLLAILLLAALGLWNFPAARPVLLGTAAVLLVAIIIIQRETWLRAIGTTLEKRLPERIGSFIGKATEMVLEFGTLFRAKALLYGLTLAVIGWGAEGLGFYYLLQRLDVPISLTLALAIYAFAMLVGAISFLPGGLGGAEATMVGLLVFNGMPEGSAVAVTIFFRLATLWFAVLLGLVALPRGVTKAP